MEKVINSISKLLESNEKVVIPNLGTFVVSQQSATIHPVTNEIEPPFKKIEFDVNYFIEGEELANFISTTENIDVEECKKQIQAFIDEVKSKINLGEKIPLNSLGVFSANPYGEVEFIQGAQDGVFNETVIAEPVKVEKTEVIQQVPAADKELKTKEKEKAKPKKNETQKKSENSGGIHWIFLFIPVVLLCGSAIFLYMRDNGKALNSLNPFNKNEVASTVDSSMITQDTTAIESDSLDVVENVENNNEETISNNNSSITTLTELTGRYYVIAAGFLEQSKAEKFRDELASKGYSNAKVLTPLGERPVFRVSIFDFETKEEGISKSTEENPSFGNVLWVLKY